MLLNKGTLLRQITKIVNFSFAVNKNVPRRLKDRMPKR